MSAHLDVAVRGTVGDTSPSAGKKLASFGKSATLWIVVIAVVLIASIIGFIGSTNAGEQRDLHYNNTGKTGTAALVGVLQSHGMNVTTTEKYSDALAAAKDSNTTLVVLNAFEVEQTQSHTIRSAVRASGSHLMLVDPTYGVSRFSSNISYAIDGQSNYSFTSDPQCGFGPAQQAGEVDRMQPGYRVLPDTTSDNCYPIGDDSYSLIHAQEGKGSVTVLGESLWVQNATLRDRGNAALSIGTAGLTPNVVVYYGTLDQDEQPDPFSATPPWFLMTILWLIPIFVVVVVWRGRRFGPLAVETLPVTVPPIETVTGLAGLMHRTGDRVEALRILRASALSTMGKTLAVPANAQPAEVCRAVADRTGRDLAELEYVFITAVPQTDTELTDLATRISLIEREVRAL